jgi:hypothetical protein
LPERRTSEAQRAKAAPTSRDLSRISQAIHIFCLPYYLKSQQTEFTELVVLLEAETVELELLDCPHR